jgi:hypothetical protein
MLGSYKSFPVKYALYTYQVDYPGLLSFSLTRSTLQCSRWLHPFAPLLIRSHPPISSIYPLLLYLRLVCTLHHLHLDFHLPITPTLLQLRKQRLPYRHLDLDLLRIPAHHGLVGSVPCRELAPDQQMAQRWQSRNHVQRARANLHFRSIAFPLWIRGMVCGQVHAQLITRLSCNDADEMHAHRECSQRRYLAQYAVERLAVQREARAVEVERGDVGTSVCANIGEEIGVARFAGPCHFEAVPAEE